MLKSLGGDRLGSGNKMKIAMHNYERSTHDLSYIWRSTMAPGTLVPFCKILAMKSDTFKIDTKALIRTMPAIGPLFGSYKLQLDFFECPLRLYNGILHNNMTKIGLDMSQVKLPKIRQESMVVNNLLASTPIHFEENNPSSLLRYMGITGISGVKNHADSNDTTVIERKFNAVPILAYYDIFKNYYANKQEENAYVINNETTQTPANANNVLIQNAAGDYDWKSVKDMGNNSSWYYDNDSKTVKFIWYSTEWRSVNDPILMPGIPLYRKKDSVTTQATFYYNYEFNLNFKFPKSAYGDATYAWSPTLEFLIQSDVPNTLSIPISLKIEDNTENTVFDYVYIDNKIKLTVKENYKTALLTILNATVPSPEEGVTYSMYFTGIHVQPLLQEIKSEIKLQPFKLENIDNMRVWLLQNTQLGQENIINDFGQLPYSTLAGDKEYQNQSHYPMQGLVVKTYQSDIFNNWLSTEWIDGVKGINAITSVAVENDAFTIDALNLANRVYNMLNRIAVSGGTYEDWLEAVYGDDAIRRTESPIYCGGASGIIAFEEVVSTADTYTETAGDQPLGTLAGKGTMVNYSGGEIDIRVSEPGYIIAIASITPLIDYCQGNDFDMTELDSVNDIHKPALDAIGFQDLMLEQAAYWASFYDDDDEEEEKTLYRNAGGKIPAWLNYMTNWNKVYGDFADKEKLGWMVLTRDYQRGETLYGGSMPEHGVQGSERYIQVADWTTYINPTKFNYQFADQELEAQNFWVQIGINIEARRKMSAKLIPNL